MASHRAGKAAERGGGAHRDRERRAARNRTRDLRESKWERQAQRGEERPYRSRAHFEPGPRWVQTDVPDWIAKVIEDL